MAPSRSEYMKEYRKRNPDYDKNRVRDPEYFRQWSSSNRERKRKMDADWLSRNPGKKAEYDARRRAMTKGATFTSAAIQARMAFYGSKCWMCHGPFEQIDRVKPLAAGGPHILANLRPACGSCNARKGDRWPFDLHGVSSVPAR